MAAISRASEHVLRAAGAWQRLDAARVSPYERMRVWHESAAVDSAVACLEGGDIRTTSLVSVYTAAAADVLISAARGSMSRTMPPPWHVSATKMTLAPRSSNCRMK